MHVCSRYQINEGSEDEVEEDGAPLTITFYKSAVSFLEEVNHSEEEMGAH